MKTILIVTNSSEFGVDAVTSVLDDIESRYIRLNVDELCGGELQLVERLSSKGFSALLQYGNSSVELEDILSVWYRRPKFELNTSSGLRSFDPNAFAMGEWKYALHSLSTTFTGYWMNNPIWGSYLLEHNKMYQMKVASEIGLKVPDTIIANDFETLVNFCDAHNGVIACKPIYPGIFSDPEDKRFGIYTQRVQREELFKRKNSIATAPVLAQEYVEKKIELRITIIGDNIFSCSIDSQASERTKHDWRRYDFANVMHQAYHLPLEIGEKLKKLMVLCKINFGAIDMIVTPEGEYVFIEVNPNGQYGWIEEITGMKISSCIAHSLSKPKESGMSIIHV